MKISTSLRNIAFINAAVAVVGGMALYLTDVKQEYLPAALLTSPDAGFYLWYVRDDVNDQRWDIPNQVGSTAELPLGITANGDVLDGLPMDSIEFKITGIPDFLQYDAVSSFPGFHVDAISTAGQIAGTSDVTVYIAPEEYPEVNGIPGGPSDLNEIGDLITETDEILRIRFAIVDSPRVVAPAQITATLTARDGEFTRYSVDGNPSLPGDDNPGSIEIYPMISGGSVQVISTVAEQNNHIRINFSVPVLPGGGLEGSENPYNYYVYKCDLSVPTPVSSDPNIDDVNACRTKSQDSVVEPGEAITATRDSDSFYSVVIETDPLAPLQEGAFYIIRIDNVSNDTSELSIPAEGIFSQMFQFSGYPSVETVTATDTDTLLVEFSSPVCASATENGAENMANYELFVCNQSTTIAECIEKNSNDEDQISVTNAEFDGLSTVTLTTQAQVPDAWYILKIKNVANESCNVESGIPSMPQYYSPEFQGFGGSGVTPPPDSTGGTLSIGLSNTTGLHLPWREVITLYPNGGVAPFTWEVVPADAGTIDDSDVNNIVFAPKLVSETGEPIHDERDVIIRVSDADGATSEIPLHIMRRGDLGGTVPLFLDKTDVQDVNDISAGWKR